MRHTGIEIVGDAQWGMHFCQLYQTKEDLLDILVPYFKSGLQGNEMCLWVTSEFLDLKEIQGVMGEKVPGFTALLKKGQIEIFSYSEWSIKQGKSELKHVLNQLVAKHNKAISEGYDGLRVGGNPFWADNKGESNSLAAYKEINKVVSSCNMMILCTYSVSKCSGDQVIDAVVNHHFAMVKRSDRWQLIESTEHKKTKETLQRNEATLLAILNATKESVWLFSREEIILMGNSTALERIGKPDKEVIGKHFKDVIPAELAKTRAKLLEKVFYTGTPLEFEDERNGIKFLHNFYPVTNEKGEVDSVVSFSRDITARKKNEEIIFQNQQRLKFHYDNSPFAVVEWDSDFIVIQWSGQAERMFGWKAEETIGKRIDSLNMIYEEDVSIVNQTMEKLTNGEETIVTSSNRNYTKSGSVIECIWHNSVMLDGSGKMKSVLSLVEDITERRKAANALHESEERFKAIAETTPVGIGVVEIEDGNFLYANSAYEKNFGYSKGELLGRKAPEVYWEPNERTQILARLKKCGFVSDYEVRLKRKDGSMFWGMTSVRPITFNEKPSLLGTFIDITQRKRAEEEIRVNSERLSILSDIASRLLASKNPQDIVNELCVRLMNFLNCHVLFNFIIDERAGKLHLNTYAGIPESTAKSIEWLDFGVAVCGSVAQKRERIVAENIPDTPDPRTDLVKSFGIKAYACHPLLVHGMIIGTLSFGTKTRTRFSNDDIAMMKAVADQVAIAMSRIRSEKELHNTKNYLENLINYANAPIIVWNPQQEIQLFNNAFQQLTGYSLNEVIDKKLDFLFPKETLKESNEKINQSLLTHLETVEIPILCKNNKIRTFLWNSANIYETDNKTLISTIAQGHDITERKAVLNQLKESQQKLELALENGSIGVWVWDLPANLIEWDERMEKIFGLKPGSFDKRYETFEACLVEEDIPHTRKAIKMALEKDVPYETIYRIHFNGEEIKYINAKAMVTKDSGGRPVKMTGVCFDITEMKKGAEKALFKVNEDLLRSNKELEQFAYMASHDLQEPLRMVSSFTQLLAQRYDDKLDSDAKEFIRFAVDGALRMQVLINDLLAYSRIHTKGKEFSRIDMHNILGQVIINLQLSIKEKNALVTNEELPYVMADEGQMVQLFQNLIANSLKFSRGTPRIHIAAYKEKDEYVFSVKDNGIGIEPQYFERIFQIFQRLQAREEYAGTGIGLAICKRIVERHGGKIWLESVIGKGTTFYFTLNSNQ